MTVSEQIIEVLDHLGQQLGIAIDWSSQNVLPYLQDLFSRYVSYEITRRWIWIGVLTLGIAALIVVVIRLVATGDSDWYCLAACAGLVALILFFIFVAQVANIVELHIIPEKVVFESLQKYLSK